MSRTRGPRIAIGAAILTLVSGVAGLVVALILNAFVLDKFDAYGEVPIPGSSRLHLPAGDVTVSFHTVVTGGPGGGGLPVPKLGLTITPPSGVAEPKVAESFGATTTVNNDSRVRVWVVEIPQDGTYDIDTAGDVNGYINPRLAFGHGSPFPQLPWIFGGLCLLGAVILVMATVWSKRSAKRARPLAPHEMVDLNEPTWASRTAPAPNNTPSDQGVRLEQLRQLAALRDSGALTEDEFQAEKRRILKD